MMENITFIFASGKIVMPEDYGLILKSFDASEPEPKLNLISISGCDGSLDLTNWAGETRYENRTVNIAFRDMRGENYTDMLNEIYREPCKIRYSADDEWYYSGRCVSAKPTTRDHVTDLELEFTCHPYRMSFSPTVVSGNVSSSPFSLKARQMSAVPQITLSASCSVTFKNVTKSLAAGTHTVPEFVITKTASNMAVTGSGTISIQWTDGVI